MTTSARLFTGARAALDGAGHSIVGSGDRARGTDAPTSTWHIVLPEASWYHAPLLRDHADKYSPGVRLRLEMGRYVLAEDYLRAMHGRAALTRCGGSGAGRARRAAAAGAADRRAAARRHAVDVGGRTEPVRATMLRLTQLFNVTGHPAIAHPVRQGRGRAAPGDPARRTPRRHRAPARGGRGGGASDNRRPRIGRRRHRVNFRTVFVLAACRSGRDGSRHRRACARHRGPAVYRVLAVVQSLPLLRASIDDGMTIKHMTVQQAHQQQSSGATYLDVRSIPEFEQGHPQGAFNIPLLHIDPGTGQMRPNPEFLDVVRKTFTPDTTLVVGCKMGGRSAAGVRTAVERGLHQTSPTCWAAGAARRSRATRDGYRRACRSRRRPMRRVNTTRCARRHPGIADA